MELPAPDTLVLKIVEYDSGTRKIDTTLYVLYDKVEEKYVIRGRRADGRRLKSCTYSFDCENATDLADFIEFLIDDENILSYILYNYDNLPRDSNEITYDFLEEYDDQTYEISGYDNQPLKKATLVKILRMLRNVFNYY